MGKNTFKLESTPNFRDLGGYNSSLGGHVKEGALYRSNSLAMLSDEDIKLILEKGIRTVIDLRTDFEIHRGQSRLKDVEGVGYYKISLIDNVHSQDHKTFEKNMPKSMGELYKNLLDNSSHSIVKVFDIILENSDSAVVFNCTAGKDRTGVIAALILDLLCVDKKDIVEDYTITEKLMESVTLKFKQDYKEATGKAVPDYLFESRQESIEEFLDHLYDKYTNAEGYLIKSGFGKEKIDKFRKAYLTKE